MDENMNRNDLAQLIDRVTLQTKQRLHDKQKSAHVTPLTPLQTAQLIDHTLLNVDAQREQISALCEEALKYRFRTVCVRHDHVALAEEKLRFGRVDIACVVGFPEGTQATQSKVAEAQKAFADGARELDMVQNYEELKAGNIEAVYNDIRVVRESVPSEEALLKVILETSQLSQGEIIAGCVISCLAGADFVKTSTGFRGRGATVEDVEVMRAACDAFASVKESEKRVRIKASGGIRTGTDVARMAQAGAERIGASAGVKIIESLKDEKKDAQEVGSGSSY
ncbi:MAG: hypothetical protein Q9227_003751 [Pyrenula ochraceoflavens]